MKARTKLQIRVTMLSHQLPNLSKEKENWAKMHCLGHFAFATKNRVLCMDCGGKFTHDKIKRMSSYCPLCGTKINVEDSKKRTLRQSTYFAIASVVKEFQVVRFYQMHASYAAGKPAAIFTYEILQHWVMADGRREVIGRNHHLNWYQDSWGGDWAIRNKKLSKYDVYPAMYHPISRFKEEYKKYGINSKLAGLTFLEAISIVPGCSHAETLLKAKQYEFLSQVANNRNDIDRYWPSVKVCMRNKYRPEDIGIWFDYLDLLRYFKKDIHNAKFVCPKNLKAEHDRLVEKKRERQRHEELERKRRAIKEAQILYAEKIKRFAGLKFTDGLITVKVLETVKEFEEEGDRLKHCVFTNDYYEKEDSLILSARINGLPIETIEVSLSKMKIQQSRGLQNMPSEHNDKIVALVQRNLQVIRKVARRKSA
jgi:DNA-directed RNA polymerase subunit RPC12/RpoP